MSAEAAHTQGRGAGTARRCRPVRLWGDDDGSDGEALVLLGGFRAGHPTSAGPYLDGYRKITLKPHGFFEENPTLDVPPPKHACHCGVPGRQVYGFGRERPSRHPQSDSSCAARGATPSSRQSLRSWRGRALTGSGAVRSPRRQASPTGSPRTTSARATRRSSRRSRGGTERDIEASWFLPAAGDVAEFAADIAECVETAPEWPAFQFEPALAARRRPGLLPHVRALNNHYVDVVRPSAEAARIETGDVLARLVFAALDGLVLQQVLYRDSEATERPVEGVRELVPRTGELPAEASGEPSGGEVSAAPC